MLPARGCLCIEDNADHDVGDLAADMWHVDANLRTWAVSVSLFVKTVDFDGGYETVPVLFVVGQHGLPLHSQGYLE